MSRRLRSRAAAIEAKRAFAWASPVVHDHDDEPADGSGPAGTYGCACVSDSARLCTLLRHDRDIDSREQHDDDCECLCHQWRDHDN